MSLGIKVWNIREEWVDDSLEKWKDLCKTPHRETAEKGEKVLQVAVQYIKQNA